MTTEDLVNWCEREGYTEVVGDLTIRPTSKNQKIYRLIERRLFPPAIRIGNKAEGFYPDPDRVKHRISLFVKNRRNGDDITTAINRVIATDTAWSADDIIALLKGL